MDLDTVAYLASLAGQEALAEARRTRTLPAHRRPDALRRALPALRPATVRAVLAQDDLRVRAGAKTPHAEALLFERTALEQATAWPVAAERATRWPAPPDVPLVDLGAGQGFDALATAAWGRPVVAVEHDPVRAALLRANARSLGLSGRVEIVEGDAEPVARRGGALALLDPDRRAAGRRTRDAARFAPPASAWDAWLGGFEAAMLELPPDAARPGGAARAPLEIVSLDGRARECRCFRGAGWGRLAARRALRLPGGPAVAGEGAAWPAPAALEAGCWLLDPDPAVTLAGLVGDLCLRDGLAPVHPRIACLVAPAPAPGAPGRWLRVAAVLRPRPREIDRWLAAHDVGRVTVKTRGVADDAATFARRLRPRGTRSATLLVTRDRDDHWVACACLDDPETGT